MSYVTQFNNLPQGEDYYTVGYDFFKSNPQYLKDYWSIFLNYLKNEDNNQQGLENSQFTSSSLFAYIASQIDFPNNSFIDTVNKNGIIDNYIDNYVSNNPSPQDHWNESWSKALKGFALCVYPEGAAIYEDDMGYYISEDGETFIPQFIHAGLSTSSGYNFRLKDIRNFDAGANFRDVLRTIYTVKSAFFYFYTRDKSTGVINKYPTNGTNGVSYDAGDYFYFSTETNDLIGKWVNSQEQYDKLLDFHVLNGCVALQGFIAGMKEEHPYDGEHEFKFTFTQPSIAFYSHPWVLPWLNINGSSYSDVRGIDKIVGALNNKKNLQFTRLNLEEPYGDTSFYEQMVQEYKDVAEGAKTYQEAKELTIAGEPISYIEPYVYGNINMNDRQIYRDGDEVITVLGTSVAFALNDFLPYDNPDFWTLENKYISFCYSPLLQTENDTPILLDEADCNSYLAYLVNTIMHSGLHPQVGSLDELIAFVIQAILFEDTVGKTITIGSTTVTCKNLIAMIEIIDESDLDNCATVDLAEALHYIGTYGAVLMEKPHYDEIAAKMGISYEMLMDLDEQEFFRYYADSVNHWMRLLMPKNSRMVEVEDLNRNFWVIAQVISAISAYLFDDEGPLNQAIKNMIGEIADMWENVEYLWAAMSILGEEPYVTKYKCMVIPLTSNELQPFHKYDNFDVEAVNNSALRTLVESRLSYLNNSMLDCNLIVLPEVRMNNYEQNYYSKVVYPGFLCFDRNSNTTLWKNMPNNASWEIDISSGTSSALSSKCIGIRERNESTYEFIQPFNSDKKSEDPYRFYRLLRPVYTLSATDFDHISCNIKYYDAAARVQNYSAPVVYMWENNSWSNSLPDLENIGVTGADITRGYYQGELLSCYRKQQRVEYLVRTEEKRLRGCLTDDGYTFSNLDVKRPELEAEDVPILYALMDSQSSQFDSFVFYTGSQLYDVATDPNGQWFYNTITNDQLITASDMSDLAAHGQAAQYERYYKVSNTNGIGIGAVLYNPKNQTIIDYPNYFAYTNYVYFGANMLYGNVYWVYIKQNDDHITADNWIIVQDIVIASTVSSPRHNDILASAQANLRDYGEFPAYPDDYVIVERVFRHLYKPNGDCLSMRKDKDGIDADPLVDGNIQDTFTTTIQGGPAINLNGYKKFGVRSYGSGSLVAATINGQDVDFWTYPNNGVDH